MAGHGHGGDHGGEGHKGVALLIAVLALFLATGEGRRELMARARVAEARRDKNMDKYHMFEYSSAGFQVAIVVASASIITGVMLLVWLAGALGAVGFGLMMLGFFAPGLIHF